MMNSSKIWSCKYTIPKKPSGFADQPLTQSKFEYEKQRKRKISVKMPGGELEMQKHDNFFWNFQTSRNFCSKFNKNTTCNDAIFHEFRCITFAPNTGKFLVKVMQKNSRNSENFLSIWRNEKTYPGCVTKAKKLKNIIKTYSTKLIHFLNIFNF